MSKPKPVTPAFSLWRTLFAGWIIILVITPLSQFLTILTVNASIETATPVGWALGLVISIILAGLVVRGLAKRQVVNRANLALLYTMLALAVPLMNIGLVRQLFLSIHTVQREYLHQGTSTYRTAYNSLNDRWFPVVPTVEGLAWNRAQRALSLLRDPQLQQRRAAARRQVDGLLQDEQRRARLLAGAATDDESAALAGALSELALDDAARLAAGPDTEALSAAGLQPALQARIQEMATRSAAARALLRDSLSATDEWPLSLVPRVYERFDYSARERLDEETGRLPESQQLALQRRAEDLAGEADRLAAAVADLGERDRAELARELFAGEAARLGGLARAGFRGERNRFVFRISRDERRAMLAQSGVNGPNQNLRAYFEGLWETPQEKALRDSMGALERVTAVVARLPWALYAWPILHWGLLVSTIFLFMMCLAEWLRRKWVSRENLPFPLVEVADHVIRHDSALETAGDLSAPAPRGRLFSQFALIGFAVGFLMLFFQGLGHYGFLNTTGIIQFDFSKNIFETAGGVLKFFPVTVFVISPIVVGIVFLLSLEVGFSIWFSYVLYALVVMVLRAALPDAMDGNWSGFADGKLYPFPMEQMLGVCLCFAAYHWWKVRGHGNTLVEKATEAYVPPLLTRWGLILLPLAILALFWDIGLTSLPLLMIFSVAVLAITLTMARVRAETGLPGQQAVYEFTKLPILLGMTGMTGAKVFTVFMNVVFLPTTLLFRTLPQQLENIELARRHRIPFRSVAAAGLSAVLLALAAGTFSFLVYSYFIGSAFYGGEALPPQHQPAPATSLATYPLWVGHFLGEPGLDRFNDLNHYRITAIAAGFGILALLLFLRQKFLRFPLHPVGYVLLLLSIHYSWADPYVRVNEHKPLQSSVLWGSALVAWGIKRLVVKYGGMNVYKQAKPLFIGMVIGSVAAVFLWNMVDLSFSLYAARDIVPGDFIRRFLETVPFTPAFY